MLDWRIHAATVPGLQWSEMLECGLSPILVKLFIKANDVQKIGGLVAIEPGSHEKVQCATTAFIDALRPIVPSCQDRDVDADLDEGQRH